MTNTEAPLSATVLKSTREKLGLSINDVSLSTKISPRILKALEEGAYKELPSQSFTRGFIKSYSSYLKIDAQPIIESYDAFIQGPDIREHAVAETEKSPEENQTAQANKNSRFRFSENSTFSRFFVVATLLAAVAVIFATKKIFKHYEQDRIDTTSSVTTTKTAELAAQIPVEQPPPEQDKPAQQASAPIVAEEIKPIVVVAPAMILPTPPKVIVPVPLPAVPVPPQVPSASVTAPNKESPQEVIVQALDRVEIEIQIDNGESKKITLAPDAIHTIKGKASISLNIKDGGMVNLIHNGKERGVPGDLGKPTRVKFP